MGTITIGQVTFEFGEVSTSGLGRGISMHRQGVAKDNHTYKFSPNPHDSTYYNKNQGKWYESVASAIANLVVTHNTWPATGTTITAKDDIAYTLELVD